MVASPFLAVGIFLSAVGLSACAEEFTVEVTRTEIVPEYARGNAILGGVKPSRFAEQAEFLRIEFKSNIDIEREARKVDAPSVGYGFYPCGQELSFVEFGVLYLAPDERGPNVYEIFVPASLSELSARDPKLGWIRGWPTTLKKSVLCLKVTGEGALTRLKSRETILPDVAALLR